ncbi:GD11963 [Drosophila simulans]|uniref:GD11963 n=1 Tax=Drosophila simulans TaxID=7240 RepID=B4NS03_DROSI|nr:GD11963 [Drosophila simulans]
MCKCRPDNKLEQFGDKAEGKRVATARDWSAWLGKWEIHRTIECFSSLKKTYCLPECQEQEQELEQEPQPEHRCPHYPHRSLISIE